MRRRYAIVWLSAFGGGFTTAGVLLAAAGYWGWSLLVFGVSLVLMGHAFDRLHDLQEVENSEEDMFVDPSGPFGWMGGKE